MAIQFTGSSDEQFDSTSVIVTNTPFTWSIWFFMDKGPNAAGEEFTICVTHSDSFNHFYNLRIDDASSSTEYLQFNARRAPSAVEGASASGSGEPATSTWNHACAIATSLSDRAVLISINSSLLAFMCIG